MRGNSSFHADVPVTGATPFATTHNAPLPNPDELWGTCFPSELLSDDICKGDSCRPADKCGGYAPLRKWQRPLLGYTIKYTRCDANIQ